MLYELWQAKDKTEQSFAPIDSYIKQPFLKQTVDGEAMEKVWEVEADTWEEACTKYHEYMGWEPYIPFDERPKQA